MLDRKLVSKQANHIGGGDVCFSTHLFNSKLTPLASLCGEELTILFTWDRLTLFNGGSSSRTGAVGGPLTRPPWASRRTERAATRDVGELMGGESHIKVADCFQGLLWRVWTARVQLLSWPASLRVISFFIRIGKLYGVQDRPVERIWNQLARPLTKTDQWQWRVAKTAV